MWILSEGRIWEIIWKKLEMVLCCIFPGVVADLLEHVHLWCEA
jgi:hypothetical protein